MLRFVSVTAIQNVSHALNRPTEMWQGSPLESGLLEDPGDGSEVLKYVPVHIVCKNMNWIELAQYCV